MDTVLRLAALCLLGALLAVLLFAFERGSAFAIPAALCIGLGAFLFLRQTGCF